MHVKIRLCGSQSRCFEKFLFQIQGGPCSRPISRWQGPSPDTAAQDTVVRKESSSRDRKWSEQLREGPFHCPIFTRPPRKGWATKSVLRKILSVRPGASCSQAPSLMHGAQRFMPRLELFKEIESEGKLLYLVNVEHACFL